MFAQFASSVCSAREARAQTYCTSFLARLSAFRFRPGFAVFFVAIYRLFTCPARCAKHFADPPNATVLGGTDRGAALRIDKPPIGKCRHLPNGSSEHRGAT